MCTNIKFSCNVLLLVTHLDGLLNVASPLLLSIKGGAADNIMMFSIKGVTEEAIGFAVEGVLVTSLSLFEIAGRFPVAK